jgi:hypothetical protein
MDGWMNGWMNGWIDGWMDEWMDRWMDPYWPKHWNRLVWFVRTTTFTLEVPFSRSFWILKCFFLACKKEGWRVIKL